jgi:serine protease AprX
VIVRAEPNELAAAQRAVTSHGGTVGQSLPVVNGFVAQVPAGSERALGATDGVAAGRPDSPMKGWADTKAKDAAATAATPGTTLSDVREAIGADQSGATGSGVDVAVIDTAWSRCRRSPRRARSSTAPTSPTRAATATWPTSTPTGTARTWPASSPATIRGSGFQGVAPGARLVNVKAAGADGSTSLGAIVASVGWVIAHRNDNGPARPRPQPLLRHAAQPLPERPARLRGRAGLEGRDRRGRLRRQRGREAPGLTSPAYDPFILSIGADDLSGTAAVDDDVVPSWSSRGLGRNPDLVAPGRSIASLRDPNSGPRPGAPRGARLGDDLLKGRAGTSQARRGSSLGAVARLLERRPDLTPRTRSRRIVFKSSADPLSGPGPEAPRVPGRLNVMRGLPAAEPRPRIGRPDLPARREPRVVAKLAAGLVEGFAPGRCRADRPRTARSGRAGKWGGSSVGGSPRGAGSSVGLLVVGRAPRGAALVGRLVVGRLVLGRLVVGRLLVGRLVLGRRLSRARPGLHAT